ncbi:DNA primase, partial [Streptomyces sp. NPDC048581]
GGALARALANGDDDYSKDEHDKDSDKEDYDKGSKDEHDKDSGKDDYDKDSDKEDYDKGDKHEEPKGGVHTGGGALASVLNDDDWGGDKDSKFDPESYKDDDHEKDSWGGDHDKPHGGMHTGGGGLADNAGVTAGGLAVLAVAGTGVYALRRKKASGTVA